MTRSRPSHRRERTGCRSHYRPTAAKSRPSARTKKAISFRFLPAILSLLKDYSREKCQSHGPLMAIPCMCTGVVICRPRFTDWMLPLVIGLSGENSCLPILPELNLLALFFPRPTAEPMFTDTGGCFPIFTSSKGCSETRQSFAEGARVFQDQAPAERFVPRRGPDEPRGAERPWGPLRISGGRKRSPTCLCGFSEEVTWSLLLCSSRDHKWATRCLAGFSLRHAESSRG